MDRLKIAFSDSSVREHVALKLFYKNLKNVKKLAFCETDEKGILVAHGNDVAYKLTPNLTLAKDKSGKKLYNCEKFVLFLGPGTKLNKKKSRKSGSELAKNNDNKLFSMTKDEAIKLCQADYNKILEKDEMEL